MFLVRANEGVNYRSSRSMFMAMANKGSIIAHPAVTRAATKIVPPRTLELPFLLQLQTLSSFDPFLENFFLFLVSEVILAWSLSLPDEACLRRQSLCYKLESLEAARAT